MIATAIIVIGFGLIIGSFLSVCIYRIPLGRFDQVDNSDLDLAEPSPAAPEIKTFEGSPVTFSFPRRSISPCCKKQLHWWHNIPLISWIVLGGRCSFCRKSIPFRYPLVEILSACCAFLSFTQYGLNLSGFLIYLFACALIVITFIDYDYFIIPNLITYPGTIIGFLLALLSFADVYFLEPITDGLTTSAFGVLAGAGFLYFVSEVYLKLRKIDGLGMGDVKLLAMIGACFGPECALFTIFVGSLIGSIGGLVLILVGGRRMSQHLPFGPSLAAGTLIYLYFAAELAAYFNLPLSISS